MAKKITGASEEEREHILNRLDEKEDLQLHSSVLDDYGELSPPQAFSPPIKYILLLHLVFCKVAWGLPHIIFCCFMYIIHCLWFRC